MKILKILFLSFITSSCVTYKDAYTPLPKEQGASAQILESSYRDCGIFCKDWGEFAVMYIDGKPVDRTKNNDSISIMKGTHTLVVYASFNAENFEACPCVAWDEIDVNFPEGSVYELTGRIKGAKLQLSILDKMNKNMPILEKIISFQPKGGTTYIPVFYK